MDTMELILPSVCPILTHLHWEATALFAIYDKMHLNHIRIIPQGKLLEKSAKIPHTTFTAPHVRSTNKAHHTEAHHHRRCLRPAAKHIASHNVKPPHQGTPKTSTRMSARAHWASGRPKKAPHCAAPLTVADAKDPHHAVTAPAGHSIAAQCHDSPDPARVW